MCIERIILASHSSTRTIGPYGSTIIYPNKLVFSVVTISIYQCLEYTYQMVVILLEPFLTELWLQMLSQDILLHQRHSRITTTVHYERKWIIHSVHLMRKVAYRIVNTQLIPQNTRLSLSILTCFKTVKIRIDIDLDFTITHILYILCVHSNNIRLSHTHSHTHSHSHSHSHMYFTTSVFITALCI